MGEFEMDIVHMNSYAPFFRTQRFDLLNHRVGSQLPWLPKKQLQGGLQTLNRKMLCKDAIEIRFFTGYEIRQAVESFIQRQNVEGIVQATCSIL